VRSGLAERRQLDPGSPALGDPGEAGHLDADDLRLGHTRQRLSDGVGNGRRRRAELAAGVLHVGHKHQWLRSVDQRDGAAEHDLLELLRHWRRQRVGPTDRADLLRDQQLGFVPLPWPTGSTSFLCVKPPTQRTPPQSSGGTIGACDGSFALDWNAFQSADSSALRNPWLVSGKVYLQAWYRDPPAPKMTNLSNAVELTYQ
jgi:hypothetical protein